MSRLHHAFDYIEITVADLAGAQRFYGEAFGWTFNAYGPGYAGIVVGSREVGGLAVAETPTSPSASASTSSSSSVAPLIILYSNDLEATLAAVEAAGGTITTAPYGFPGGRRFHFADPSGNTMAVWTECAAH